MFFKVDDIMREIAEDNRDLNELIFVDNDDNIDEGSENSFHTNNKVMSDLSYLKTKYKIPSDLPVFENIKTIAFFIFER